MMSFSTPNRIAPYLIPSITLLMAEMLMATPVAQGFSMIPTNDPNLLVNTLVDGVVPISGISWQIAPGATSIFHDGFLAGLGIDQGILLTTGQATDALGSNGNGTEPELSGVGNPLPGTQFGASVDNRMSGDPQLSAIVNAPTYDATFLQFNFIAPTPGTISFNYIFASEEYIDYENTSYNDVFGFFLNGYNIARLPVEGNPAVSINTVNSVKNTQFFHQNISNPYPGAPAPYNIEYDGFTNVLVTLNAPVMAGTNTIRLAIADTADALLDSAVFLEKGSFKFQKESVPEPISLFSLATIAAFILHTGIKRQSRRHPH